MPLQSLLREALGGGAGGAHAGGGGGGAAPRPLPLPRLALVVGDCAARGSALQEWPGCAPAAAIDAGARPPPCRPAPPSPPAPPLPAAAADASALDMDDAPAPVPAPLLAPDAMYPVLNSQLVESAAAAPVPAPALAAAPVPAAAAGLGGRLSLNVLFPATQPTLPAVAPAPAPARSSALATTLQAQFARDVPLRDCLPPLWSSAEQLLSRMVGGGGANFESVAARTLLSHAALRIFTDGAGAGVARLVQPPPRVPPPGEPEPSPVAESILAAWGASARRGPSQPA